MDQYRPRLRRPDKALYVPKARRHTGDGDNVSSENTTGQTGLSSNETPNQNRSRNTRMNSNSAGQEHGDHQNRKFSRSPISNKQSEHGDQGTDYIVTEKAENDSLSETFNSLNINEKTTSTGSVESRLSASHIDSTATVHHSFSSKETEPFLARAPSTSHRQEKQNSLRRKSEETWAARDKARRKANVKGKVQSRKSECCADALGRSEGMSAPGLARLYTSTEQLRGDATFVCNQANLGLCNTVDNSWECKVENIDSTTVQQSAVLFPGSDSAEVISVSDTTKDPSGQLTVLESNADNTGNALLYEKQENITERKLDPSPVVAECALEEDNRAIVCAIEPSSGAEDEHGADLKPCQSESIGAGLDGILTSNTAPIRPLCVSEADGEHEADISSYVGPTEIQPGGRCSTAYFESHIDQQSIEELQTMGSADLEPDVGIAELPHVLVNEEAVVTSEPQPALINVEPNAANAEPIALASLEVAEKLPTVEVAEPLPAGVNAEPLEAPSKQAEPCLKVVCPNKGMVLNCSDDLKEHNTLTGTDGVLEGCTDPVRDPYVTSLTPGVASTTDESWDSLFTDDGECVDPHLIQEVKF